MDYGRVIKFSFAWLSNKETIKYALIKWIASLIFFALLGSVFWLLFSSTIASIMSNPMGFLSSMVLNPQGALLQLLPPILIFIFLYIIISIIWYFIGLYISVLFFFYAFRAASVQYVPFSFGRLFKLFILEFATAFLVLFSWVHRKAWLIPVAALIALLLLPLMLFNPTLVLIPAAIFLGIALFMVVFPIYLYINWESNPNVVVTKKIFLLIPPLLIILLMLSIIIPLFLLLCTLLFLVYVCIVIYNAIRAMFSTVIFLEKGSAIIESIQDSVYATKGKVVEALVALIIGGIAGMIFFLILALIGQAILSIILLPFIPENLWGLSDVMQLLALASSSSAQAMQPALAMARPLVVAQFLAANAWDFIIAPFAMLFYVFLTIGIYLGIVSAGSEEPEKKPKKKKA